MKVETPKLPRKIFFINKKFQSHFIIRISIGILFSTILLSTVIFYLSQSGTTVVFRDFRLEVLPTSEYILSSLSSGLIISIIAMFSIYFVLGLIYSHRISGPMFRFEKIFKNLEGGDLKQYVALRHNDEWQETAESLNKAISSVRSKMNKVNESFLELKNALENDNNPEILKKIHPTSTINQPV